MSVDVIESQYLLICLLVAKSEDYTRTRCCTAYTLVVPSEARYRMPSDIGREPLFHGAPVCLVR